MKLDIRGKNIEVTDALRDYTTKRLSKLEKYFDDVREAQVALSVDSEGHKVEVTILCIWSKAFHLNLSILSLYLNSTPAKG
jgi:ribosomal subunit interface protein